MAANKVIMCKEMPIGKQLKILSKLYFGELKRKLTHLEVERHFSVLVLIHHSGNKCTQQYIADILEVDKTVMVGIMDYLVEKKFIKRVMNPDDRREYWVQLTEKAQKNMPEINQAVQSVNASAMKKFSKAEITLFYEMLQRIHENLT